MVNLIPETYFHGTLDEWLNQIPEDSIDRILNILSIDNKAIIPRTENMFGENTKESLWRELVILIHSWGQKSSTQSNTSPSDLKKYAISLNATLTKALRSLNALEYQYLFTKGTISKEFMVANYIRYKSKEAEVEESRNVTPLIIKQEYEQSSEWGKYYPLDFELSKATESLKLISENIDAVINDLSKRSKGRGKQKISKDLHDELLWRLCLLYKKYTGEIPISWTTGASFNNPHKISGRVIPYLQEVLSHTHYGGACTATALQKKIYRMTKDPEYQELWEDSKK